VNDLINMIDKKNKLTDKKLQNCSYFPNTNSTLFILI